MSFRLFQECSSSNLKRVMNRTRWVVFALAGLALEQWLSVVVSADESKPSPRPNIIFILADDLGYGDLGCYGQKKIQTPHLDRMAAEGLRFTQFYAGSTVCAPSRSVLMTGQHLGHTTVRGNAGKDNMQAQTLRDEDVTVPEVLKSASYSTGLIGKWGLGEVGSTGHPNRQGFAEFFGFLNQHHAHNHYPGFLWRNSERVALPNVVEGATRDGVDFGAGYSTQRVQYAGDLFAAEATSFIERHAPSATVKESRRPFFLYLALTVPHANNERSRALGDGQEVPDYGPYADLDWTPQNKGQAAMVTRMDRQIGDLFSLLKKLHLDEQTLVFFSSDNGPHREGGNMPDFFDANGPFTGLKRSLTDGGIRVPFIARWPGHIQGGSVSHHVGYFGDMLPTLAELAGIQPNTKHDGISIVPTLFGQEAKQPPHKFLYWEFYEGGVTQAVLIDGRWKGIRTKKTSAPIQLFDLQNDISESIDVADKNPAIVQQAAEQMRLAHIDNEFWKLPLGHP